MLVDVTSVMVAENLRAALSREPWGIFLIILSRDGDNSMDFRVLVWGWRLTEAGGDWSGDWREVKEEPVGS